MIAPNTTQLDPAKPAGDLQTLRWRALRSKRVTQRSAVWRLAGWDLKRNGGDWKRIPYRAVAGCGRALVKDSDGFVEVRQQTADDGTTRAWTSGVQRCGSVWLCPVCSATIRQHRQEEVGVLAAAHEAVGGVLSMATFTVRHTKADPLRDVYGAVKGAWKSFQQSVQWRWYRRKMAGTIVATEVTVGDNGWHVHLHVLLLWSPDLLDPTAVEDSLAEWAPDAWAERVERRLGRRPTWRGFHLIRGSQVLARYVAKVAAEVTRSDYKTTDALGVILDGLVTVEQGAVRQWREWCDVMIGKRAVVFSRGLRKLYGVDEDVTDEDIVGQDRGGVPVGLIARRRHSMLTASSLESPIPRLVPFLERVERGIRPPGLLDWREVGDRQDLGDDVRREAKRASAHGQFDGAKGVGLWRLVAPDCLVNVETGEVHRRRRIPSAAGARRNDEGPARSPRGEGPDGALGTGTLQESGRVDPGGFVVQERGQAAHPLQLFGAE